MTRSSIFTLSLVVSSFPSGLLLISGLDNACHGFPKKRNRFKSTFNFFGNKCHYFDLINSPSDSGLRILNQWMMVLASRLVCLFNSSPPLPLVHKAVNNLFKMYIRFLLNTLQGLPITLRIKPKLPSRALRLCCDPNRGLAQCSRHNAEGMGKSVNE